MVLLRTILKLHGVVHAKWSPEKIDGLLDAASDFGRYLSTPCVFFLWAKNIQSFMEKLEVFEPIIGDNLNHRDRTILLIMVITLTAAVIADNTYYVTGELISRP